MLASAFGVAWVQYLIAPLVVLIVVGIARAALQTYKKAKESSQPTQDLDSISEFLFGTEANPRTRTPARQGWADQVDERLKNLDAGQLETINLVKKVLKNQEAE